MKERAFVILTVLSFLISLGFISAANTCWDDSQIIFRISGDTNAHAEIWNGSGSYTTEICFDEIFGINGTGVRTCDLTNKVVGLSSSTNAHAEEPSLDNYGTDICYEGLKCQTADEVSCPTDYFEIASLRLSTNSHVATPGNYPLRLCCKVDASVVGGAYCNEVWDSNDVGVNECDGGTWCTSPEFEGACTCQEGYIPTGNGGCELAPTCDGVWDSNDVGVNECDSGSNCIAVGSANECTCSEGYVSDSDGNCSTLGNTYWADESEIEIPATSNSDGNRYIITSIPQTIKIVIEKTGNPNGQNTIEIFEDDTLADDGIRTSSGGNALTTTNDANGRGVATWQITQDDLTNAKSGLDDSDEKYEFYMTYYVGIHSYTAEILYAEEGEFYCEVNQVNSCGEYGSAVNCNLDTCNVADSSLSSEPYNIDCATENCGCEWDYDSSVCEPYWDGGSNPVGKCTYTEDLSGDPNGCEDGFLSYSWTHAWVWDSGCDSACQTANAAKRNQCKDGSSTVQCPAEIQLPFFGTLGMISTFILVALGYIFSNRKKSFKKK